MSGFGYWHARVERLTCVDGFPVATNCPQGHKYLFRLKGKVSWME
uniref:Uncharacterized protein n=1 Tax=Rhizophora mucronata TaxID=61149 RepID=A0A2P2N383_RHIMU